MNPPRSTAQDGPGTADNARAVVAGERVEAAIRASVDGLLADQRADGDWPNPRPGAISGAAAAIMALHSADPVASADLIGRGRAWLLDVRNQDGGWGTLAGLPSDVVATSLAAAALRLTGSEATTDAVSRAMALLDERGGVAGLADPMMAQLTGLVLSVAGLHDPRGLRRIPVELVLLPAALRRRLISYLAPPFLALALLQSRQQPGGPLRRLAYRLARPAALRMLAEIERQEGGVGSYGGDPWLTGMVTTALARLDAAPELVAAGLGYLRMTAQPDGSWHMIHGMRAERVEVTGPAYVAASLSAAGHVDDERLRRARAWLRGCQQDEPFPAYDCPPGGWAWSGRRGWPNVLDSLAVLKVLLQPGDRGGDERLRRGIDWLRRRQDRRGSWSTFVRDSLVPLDGPCPFITAESVEILLDAGTPPTDRRIRRAVRWLLTHPGPDGAYRALWHRGGVPGTSAVLRVLVRLGLAEHPVTVAARRWLLAAQLPDGSWSGGPDGGTGTAEETGWAVRALAGGIADPASGVDRPQRPVPLGQPGGEAVRAAVVRGVKWLLDAQRPDGRWSPGAVCVYIRDHVFYVDDLICQGLALEALVAYRESERPRPAAGGPGD